MYILKIIAKSFFNLLPVYSPLIYKIASRYVDRFNGDNNSEFESNGESRLLLSILCQLEGGVVFDIGANIGEWSKYCLGISPQVELHLFEPSLLTYNELLKNTWSNNVHLNNFGLGEKEETLNLNIFDDASGMNSLYARSGIGHHQIVKTESVKIRTVDDYCNQHNIHRIDFMKIDVEGHELWVLKGAKQMLTEKRISMIQFEYGGCNLDARVYLRDIWDLLDTYDYKLAKIHPNKLYYFQEYEQQLEVFKYSNWVAFS